MKDNPTMYNETSRLMTNHIITFQILFNEPTHETPLDLHQIRTKDNALTPKTPLMSNIYMVWIKRSANLIPPSLDPGGFFSQISPRPQVHREEPYWHLLVQQTL